MSSNIKIHHKLHLKAIVTFKGGWGRLYYTQHTLLSNVRQLGFFFFFEKQIHTLSQGRGKEVLTQIHTINSIKKPW